MLHGDVVDAARALLRVPPEDRPGLCKGLLRQAEAADRYVRRFQRNHPKWGNGSLMSAARKHPLAAEREFDDLDYCRCVLMVLDSWVAWKVNQTRSVHTALSQG